MIYVNEQDSFGYKAVVLNQDFVLLRGRHKYGLCRLRIPAGTPIRKGETDKQKMRARCAVVETILDASGAVQPRGRSVWVHVLGGRLIRKDDECGTPPTDLLYEPGKILVEPNFSTSDRTCAPGIHFFKDPRCCERFLRDIDQTILNNEEELYFGTAVLEAITQPYFGSLEATKPKGDQA